ncbi:MAG TPA: riboflavin synthase [Candidatus Dormibacteraeota bacterium]|nr:riboflavin synthase [Candidatus Dormibacteraeota bacterium]
MFSGIVERVGTAEGVERAASGTRLKIRSGFEHDPAAGESVAVNGVCLTVERASSGVFEAVVVGETLRRTTLGSLESGSRVNLERAVRIGDPLGGHWVQGHVDAVATIGAVSRDAADVRVEIEIPPAFRRYVAEKGSLAVDGVSLTVAAVRETAAVVALVPYTLSHTIASEYAPGGRVNLEVDIVARYLEKLLEARGYFNEAAGVASAAGRTR